MSISSKGEILCRSSLRRCIPAIIILCTSVWWASAYALAQEAAPAALKMTAHSTLWSLEGPESNTAPHLVIDMANRGNAPSYSSLRSARDEAASPSPRNTISRSVGPVASVNRAEKGEFDPPVLSSLSEPTEGARGLANSRAGPTRPRQTIQQSPDLAGAKVYSLLADRAAPGSFPYEYQTNYLPPKQRLAINESFRHEVGQAPRSLFELEFGGWRLPVMLSGTGFRDSSPNPW
jgi:hypothetical protein